MSTVRVDTIAGMLVVFVVAGALSALVERRWHALSRAPYFARSRLTDWVYWPFTAFVTGNLTRLVTLGALGCVVFALGYRGAPRGLLAWLETDRRFGLGWLPAPAQFFIALCVGDFVNYWNHRLRHTRWLWPFHAVHHAPRTLDWLAASWMHPVDDLLDNVGVGLVLLAIGTSPSVWLATGPFFFFFNMWLHANLSWRCGPLAYVIATPAFHRWHHAEGPSARPCNFADFLPLWDLLFGTFHLPDGLPSSVGPGDTPVPAGLLAQLAFPFRRRRAAQPSSHRALGRSQQSV